MSAAQDPRLVLARLLAEADRLYSLPAVAMRVLELTRNPEIDTRALKECLENDPALTGKILRVVNSSLFGLGSHVSDLGQALTLLGTKPLKLLVLGFSLPPALFSGVSADVLARYWRHTLTRAVVARELFERLFDAPGDEAFLAGLLRDLGVLLLIQELGEPYTRLLGRVSMAGADLTRREREAMGFDHRELSADLLAHWGLPESLVLAVDPRRGAAAMAADGPLPPLAETVEAAEWFAQLLAEGDRKALGNLFEIPAGRQLCRFGRDELIELVEDFDRKVCQLADILSLKLPEGRDYRDILAEAHDQLAAVAADAVEDLIDRNRPPRGDAAESALRGAVGSLAAAAATLSTSGARHRPQQTAEDLAGAAAAPITGSAAASRPRESSTAANDPGLLDRLSVAATACRQCRRPLSLLLVQFDSAGGATAAGDEGPLARLSLVEAISAGPDYPGAARLPFGQSGFALILPGCDREEAVRLGHRLIADVAARPRGGRSTRVSASVGVASVAMPPKNFSHQELLASADRCLYAALASGGGVVKSIEIY